MNTFQFFNNTPLKSHPSVVGPLHGLHFYEAHDIVLHAVLYPY